MASLLARAEGLASSDVRVMHNLAVLAMKRRDLDEGARRYRALMRRHPGYEPGRREAHALAARFFERGILLLRHGQLAGALVEFERAVIFRPDYDGAHFNRGVLLGKLGRTTEQLDAFDAAIRANPNHTWARFNRSGLLERLGRTAEALAGYEAILAINPDFFSAYVNRGMIHYQAGRYRRALDDWRRAEALATSPAVGSSMSLNVRRARRKLEERAR